MPPAASRHEQIMAQLRTTLAAINATAEPTVFNYTPTNVLRVEDLDPRFLRTEDDVDILILEGDEFPLEETTAQFMVQAEAFILTAKKWQPNSTSPYAMTPPIGATIRSRLVQDVETAIFRDLSLGGLVDDVEVRDVNRDVRIEQTVMWSAAELRLLITYTHLKGTP